MKLVIFDMDGVLFEHPEDPHHKSVWTDLAKRLATPELRAAADKYLKTDYDKLLEIAVGELWKGKSAQPFLDLVAEMRYLPGAEATMKALKARGHALAIITSGPRLLMERAQEELGIDLGAANHLEIKDGVITGNTSAELWPVRNDAKTPHAERFAAELGLRMNDVVMVGDEENDIPLFKAAGTSIAFNTSNEKVIAAADHRVTEKDLTRILELV